MEGIMDWHFWCADFFFMDFNCSLSMLPPVPKLTVYVKLQQWQVMYALEKHRTHKQLFPIRRIVNVYNPQISASA